MPNFIYSALDAKGEQTDGVLSAASEAEAIQILRSQHLFPTQVFEEGSAKMPSPGKAPKKSKSKSISGSSSPSKVTGAVKPKILMIFTRQLATLIDAGLPLLRSLTVLAKQEPNPVLKSTINSLADSVQGGSTFSESLAQHPKIFNKLFVNMVKAGELGGVLEVVLNRLAEYQEKAHKLKNKIVSAMVYPAIVMFIAVAILVFLMIVIVPEFEKMFSDNDADLPPLSKAVFGFSRFCLATPISIIPNVVWLFVIGFLIYLGLNAFGKTTGGRTSIDKMKLHLPVFGDIQRKSAVSRFARTLGTLVTSGVPILQALNITRDTAGNVIISNAISKVHEAVKEGESIVTPLTASGVFPNMLISMVDVGEETGQLPEMLLKIADVYDDEVDNSVTALTSILEPIMIVFLALVVGTIVFALFLPLIKMISTMSDQT
ncbi:MAG: hypothetical protein RL346_825 [Verrucomicrobiota bacterium]|jgi:type IV pilus assembly protein PilC